MKDDGSGSIISSSAEMLIDGEAYLVGAVGLSPPSASGVIGSPHLSWNPSSYEEASASLSDLKKIASPLLVRINVGAPVFAQFSIQKKEAKGSNGAHQYRWIRGNVERKLDGLFLIQPTSADDGAARWLSVDKLSNVVSLSSQSPGSHVLVMARDEGTIGVFEGRVSEAIASGTGKEKHFRISYSTDSGKSEKISMVSEQYVFKYHAPFPREKRLVAMATRAVAIQSLVLVKDALESVPFWVSRPSAVSWKDSCNIEGLLVGDGRNDGGSILLGIHYLDWDEGWALKRLRSRGFEVDVLPDHEDGVSQRYMLSRPFYCNNLQLDESELQRADRRTADELLNCMHDERRLNILNVRVELSLFFQRENGDIADGSSSRKNTIVYGEDMRLVWIDVEGRRFRASGDDIL